MQTPQQQRACYALERVQKAIQSRVDSKEYSSYASGLPAMIRMNGLGQAAAFYRAKGSGKDSKAIAYLSLYRLLSDWLCKEPLAPFQKHPDLLEGITRSDMHSYLLAQAEALALLDWVKKFAKAFMKPEDETENR